MRTLRFLLQKEFRQIFRDRSILPMIFLMPTIQLLILPQAADFDVRSITLAVVDQDHSTYSRQLVSKVLATGYFHLTGMETSYQTALRYVEQDRADLILQIPAGFERKLVRENAQSLFVAIDAINGSKASIGGSYLT
ncbi:MAG: ABC transporter permease, partial [Siphonobacter aquaeclarae]|nr:ABC transporter permease [Siphonobacter aquaeclarae]